jgi:hypothetical protein
MAGPNANLPDGSQLVGIPLGTTAPWYSFLISLSGVQYQFTLRYLTRPGRWYWDVADALGTPIIYGAPLLIGVNLLGRFVGQEGFPVGTFFVEDDTGAGAQPGRDSFGVTHSLLYIDPLAVT